MRLAERLQSARNGHVLLACDANDKETDHFDMGVTISLLAPSRKTMSEKASGSTSIAALTLGAIGVVYGDIGTSPLYTMKEVFAPAHGIAASPANVLGVVSLILWCLIIVISLKYVTLVLRADNGGEGGIMALTALALKSVSKHARLYYPVMLLGLSLIHI